MATYDTSFYTNQYEEYAKKQDENAKKKADKAEAEYNAKLKQAYISRMQEQKNLDQNLAKAGIRGGASETANLALATNYQNTRNTLNAEKTQAVDNIYSTAEDNKFAYKQTTDAAAQSYVEQREAEDRQIAQNEEAQAKEAETNFWTSKYSTYYDVAKLNKAYKNAKTKTEKAIIYARIGYIKAQQKGY